MLRIKLLTDDEQNARICEDYWRQDKQGEFVLKIREIATSYSMKDQDVSKFVKKNAFVWRNDIVCVQCNKAYQFTSRAQYKDKYKFRNQVCGACIEAKTRNISDKKKLMFMEMRQTAQKEQIALTCHDLKSKIYLLATIKALADEPNTKIEPLSSHPACTLSPDPDYDKRILNHLIDKHILLFSFDIRLELKENYKNGSFRDDIDRHAFELAYPHEKILNLIDDLSNNEKIYELKQSKEFIDLCKEIQFNECLAFLKKASEEHQLCLATGNKVCLVILQCLKVFSVAQVYNFIWRGVKDSAAYYMRGRIGKRQTANATISNISRNMERALAYNWDIIPFHRNFTLTQSSLSHFIFDIILDSKDGGFEWPLHELLYFD